MSVSDDLYVYYYSGGTKYYVYASSNDNNFYGTTDTNNATVFNFKQNSNLANNSWYLTFTPPVFDNRTLVRFMGNIIQETESDTQINSLYGKSLGSEGNQLQGSYLRTDQSPTIMPSTSDIAFTEYIIQGGTTDFYTEFIDSNVPTFSSIALNTLNTILTITFSESVYNTNGGSGDLETSDFTVQLSGGNASSPSLTAISKTNQSVWQLSLSYTGTPNGSETLTIEPASSSIYDAAGNAASTSQSNNTTSLNPFPTISSTVLSSNNTTRTVTFSEGVYNTSGGSGDLETSDFTLTLSGGVAQSPTISNISKTNELIWVLTISFTGDSDGTEILTVNPASTTSIYNSVGNAASTSQSNNTAILNDVTAPTINTLTISSNNSIKTNYAGENDIVTLYITASEDIITPTVVFQSNGVGVTNAVTYSGSGNSWNAQYTVSSSDENGVISFVLNIEDEAGNQLNGTNATTDSSSVTKVGSKSIIASTTSTTNGLQLGNNINGTENSENAYHCALSSDGNIVALGSNKYNSFAGQVRIYQRDTTNDLVEPLGWTQLGNNIDGQANDTLGGSISLNSNGNIIVIGGSGSDISDNDTGVVKVYQRDSTAAIGWTQLGNNIFGDEADDHLGVSVSINSDGTIIAVGASNGGTNSTGYVKVYQRDTNATLGWTQLGNNISGHQYGGTSTVCSINDNGTIVAIGYQNYQGQNGDDNKIGGVRIWQRDITNNSVEPHGWTQLGGIIEGEEGQGTSSNGFYYDNFGNSVAINGEGNIVIIGAKMGRGLNNTAQRGYAKVYQRDESASLGWTQLGNKIINTNGGRFGTSVSINSDGNIIAVSAYSNGGYSGIGVSSGGETMILQRDTTNNSVEPHGWTILGSIWGQDYQDYEGYEIALNADGSIVATGAYFGDGNENNSGHIRVLETGANQNTYTYIVSVPPDLVSDSLSIVSNNSNTTKAKATDEVTLSFEYDLSINTPTVSFQSNGQDIADTSITYAGTNDNTSWTAKYTVDSSDTDGSVTFTIDATAQTTSTDATQLTESDITDGTNVIIDTTVPTITNTVISNDNLNLSVTFSEKIGGSSTYNDTAMVFNVTVNGDLNGGGNYIISGGNITDPTQTNHAINCNAGQTIVFSMATTDYNSYKLGIGDGPSYNQILSVNLDDTDSRFSTTVDGDNTLISFTPTENSSEWYYYCAQDPYPNGWGAQITVSNGIETTDFTLSLTGGSSATLQSNTPTNITTLDNLTYDMSLNISGVATGEETLSIVPASSTSIYDAAGNAMSTTQSNNTVNLTDLALPTINSLTISSNNSIKTNYAGENDIVTLNIVASEDIITPTVVFKSNDVVVTNAVSYSGAGDSWTAQYTVSSSDTNGIITFTLNIEDLAGNTNQRTLTTDSTSVTKVQNTDINSGVILQIGNSIPGSVNGDFTGYSVAFNQDGSIVAIGAPNHDNGGTNKGEVRIYQKDQYDAWSQMGGDLNGTNDNEQFGHSVDLNGDGTILGVGSKDTSNNLIIYKYDGSAWNQYGNNIHVVNNNISYDTHYLTPSIKVKLNKEGDRLVTSNKYNVSKLENVTTSTTNTFTHTSPYRTYGCTNNFDFRTVSGVGITDDIGGVSITYEKGYTTASAGSSTITDGFYTSHTNGSVATGMKIGSGFTYGGENMSMEFYINIVDTPSWSRLFRFDHSEDSNGYFEIARPPNPPRWNVRTNNNSTVQDSDNRLYDSYTTGEANGNTFDGTEWIHYVFTFGRNSDNNQACFLYENGELKSTIEIGIDTNVFTTNNSNNDFTLGSSTDNGSDDYRYGMNAYWKYFRYYHNKTLSLEEVQALYNDREDTSTANGRDGTLLEGTNQITTTTTTPTTTYYEDEVVQVYEYSAPSWNQIGNTIESSSLHDISGGSIDINEAGSIIAIGYPNANGSVSNSGLTKIYQYSNSTWTQLGTNINGENNGDYAGTSVSLDKDGNYLAIGAPYNGAGKVSVYHYNSNNWTKLGNDINGNTAGDNFGYSIALSNDASNIAIGAPNSDNNTGHVNIYEYKSQEWSKIGSSILGSENGETFGYSLSSNNDAFNLAIGVPNIHNESSDSGHVDLYKLRKIAAIPPVLVSDSVSIVSNNYDTTKAKAIDEVTLSFEYDLSINTPMVSFFSDGVGITDSEIDYVGTNDNTSWTAKYTVDSADTDGVVTFTIDASAQTTATDATQLTESDITDGTNVTVDTTIPTITGTTISSNNVNLQVTFSEFVVNTSSYTDAGLIYTVTANGSSNYIFNGSGLTDSAQPSISLFVGQTVTFSVSSSVNSSHPLIIGTVAESNDNNDIITTSDSRLTSTVDGDNTLISFTPYDNGTFYYYCDYHSGMGNSMVVTGGLEPSDLTVEIAGGVATVAANPTSLSTTSNTLFDLTLDVTNASSADGNEVLTVKPTNATSIFDKVGNPMVVEQSNNTVNLNDKTLPTAAITYTLDGVASTGPFGDGDTVVIIATFSEDMLDSNDVTLIITGTGSVTSETVTMTRVNATEYNYNYTPPVSQNGSATLQVSGGTDLAGNAVVNTPTSGDTFNIVNDTTPPTAAITYSYAGPYKNGGSNVIITATFNEDMADSPAPRIIITGSGIADVTASDMTKVTVTEYTYEYIIPTGDGTGTITLSTGTDLAGNVITSVPTSGDTFTVDNTAPTISSTSLSADNTTITVNFSDNVYNAADDTRSDLETSDFALSITGGIATLQSPTPSSINRKSDQEYDLTINYTPGSVARGNEILKVVPLTTSIFDLAGNAASDAQDNTDNKVTLNDTEAPTVISVTTTTASGNYNDASPIIPIKITFSENVFVDTTNGTPQLTLNIGGSGHSINYDSGSDSSELIFNYTILNGHNELNLDYEGTGSLALNGGTIKDAANNDAVLTLPSPGTSGSISESKVIVIDTTHPNVADVTSTKPDGSYKQGEVIDIEVEFTESVDVNTSGGTPQLVLDLDGTDVSIDYTSGSGSSTLVFQYTVESNENSGNLDYSTTGSLTLNGGTIKDSANNDAALTLPSPGATNSLGANKNIVIDNTDPTVTDITATTANGTYRVGTVIPIQVFFSETVIVDTTNGSPQITLAFDNAVTKAVNYTSGSNSNTLVFNYAIESGENTNDLDYSTTGSLSLNGGTIKDVAGNDANLTLFTPAAPGSLGDNKQLAIDTTNPTVVSFTIDDSALKKSETATVTLEFSEAVSEFDSDVDITTTNGSLTKMTSSDNNITWTGTFTPTDDSESSTNSLTLSNNYTDIVGNGGITATTANFSVDTLTASVTSFVLDDTSLIKGETANVILVFSEAVSGFDSNTDITVQNGVLSQMTSENNSSWTGTFTPTDDIDDTTGLLTLADTYTDVAGNTGVSASTASFGVDTKLPTVVTFALANSALSSGSTTTVSLVFSEAVSGFNSNDDITTENGTLTQMTSNDNNITWTGTFTPSVDIEDTSNTLTLQTSLTDVAGNQIASQTYTSNYVIDTLIPTINNVTASNANGTYKEGDVISIEVYFNEPVNVTVATPYIEISVGGNTVNVDYTSGSSTNNLTFEYTVQSGITETTGINYVATDSLNINGAEIKDNYGNNAILTLPATDSANSLLGNKTIFIDTTPATIDSVALAADNTYITVSFNEDVFNTESGSGDLETTDFTLDITGGTANFSGDVTSSLPSNITVIDNRSFRLFMSFNGLPSGDEVVTVNPASNSIFDIAGNASTTTQTGNEVTLNDQALPILTTVEISSTNDSTNFAKVGDVVTLNIVANELLYNTPTIEFRSGGNPITNAVNIAGTPNTTTFQFSYTIDANDSEGDITFTISNYVDRNSNIGLDVTTLTNGSTITLDKVVPTLTSVTYSTDNASSLQSKVGDTITLDITASEIISAPTVDFKTNGVTHTTQTMIGSGNSYTSSFVTSNSHDDGNITFTISNISDQANNDGINVNTVTSGNILIFDKTAPTFSNLSLTTSNSVNTISKDTDVVTLVMTSSEDLTAPPTVLFKSGTTDLTTVTATQPNLNDNTQFSASFTVSNAYVDGEIGYVISNFTDVAGNAGTTYTENSSGVFIDNTSPTITGVAVDGNNTQIELTLSEEVYSNSNGSGVLATTDVYLVLIGGTATLSSYYPTAITPIGGDLSRYTLTIDTILQGSVQGSEVITITPSVDSMYDSAGNVASVTQSNNTVQLNDTSLPSMTSVSISSDNGNPSLAKAGNTITLDLICDESVSVPTVSFNSGLNPVNGAVTITPNSGNNTTYTATYVVDSNDTDGNVTFSVSNFQDANGNTGNTATIVTDSTSVSVDTTEPTFSSITMTANNSLDNQYAKRNRTVTLDIQANENINTPTVSFTSNGDPVNGSVTVAGLDDSYTASFVVQHIDTDGLVEFEISNISDLIGNTASNITTLTSGSGVTIDKVSPSISSVTIASNNSSDTSFVKVGETIQLTITADEPITTPNVEFTIDGQSVADSVTVTGSGTTYIAEYTISSSDSEGLVGFSISSYTDLARNNGSTVSATTDSSQVTVDNTLPTLTTVSIASNNSVSNTAAKSGDVITLTIVASEDITAPTVTMNSGGQGLTNAGVVSGTGDSYTAEFTVDSGDRDGNCTFTISGYEDSAGNAGLGITAVTDSTSVKVDNTPPKVYTTSLNPTSVGASGTVVTVTFTEEVSGFALDDVTANEGVVSDLNTDDNITYTFKYTPNSNYSATSDQKIIEIGTNYVDLAGNQAVSSAPINSVLTTAASSNAIENIILTNINSEIDPDITSADITTVITTTGLPNNIDAEIVQTVSNVTFGDLSPAIKTQLITALEDEYANYQLNIDPGRVSVALTSGSVVITTTIASVDAVTGSAITVDATGPYVSYFNYQGFQSPAKMKQGNSAFVQINFSEGIEPSSFTADAIVTPDATVRGLQGAGANWQFFLDANDNVESTYNTITILGTYTDTTGNLGTEYNSGVYYPNTSPSSGTFFYSIDSLAPTPTITALKTTIQDTETTEITITFNEKVVQFSNDDITVTNGSLTTLSSSDGDITWTATFTPTSAGVAQIQVNSGAYYDEKLNPGTAASLTITVQGESVFTDEPNECLPDSLNNNTLTGVKSMPLKDGSSNNDASFALGRKQHTSRMLFTNSNTTTKLTKKWSYNRDASSVIARRKAGSMGASLNKTGGKISFTSPNDHNTVDRALQRVRAGGAVVPKKSANNK